MIDFSVTLNEERQRAFIVARYSSDFPGFVPAFLLPTDVDPLEDDSQATGLPTLDELERSDVGAWASGVTISREHIVPGFSRRLPFSYQIVTPRRPDGTPHGDPLISSALIRIVAAPGVRITLLPALSKMPLVRIDVVRVQDPACIPDLGEAIDMSLLLANNGVPMHRQERAWFHRLPAAERESMFRAAQGSDAARQEPLPSPDVMLDTVLRTTRVVAMPQRDGMVFFDNLSRRALQVRVPLATRGAAAESTNEDARFGYRVDAAAPAYEPAVRVAASADVEVTQFFLTPEDDSTRTEWMAPFALHRIGNFHDVPLPGNAIPTRYRARTEEIPLVAAPPALATTLARLGVDVGIGLIPVVGDAIDLLELAVAAMTGRDRWGQRVGPLDLALMGLGSVLPFVGSRTVRAVGTAVLFGTAATSLMSGGDESEEGIE